MGTEFTPIFLFIVVAVFTAISMIVLSAIIGPEEDDGGQADAV